MLGRGQAAAPAVGRVCKASLQKQISLPSILKEARCWGDRKNSSGFAVLSRAGTKGSVSVHCWARRRGDRGPHPSRNAERAADTAGHSTQTLLWHKGQKEKNEINHEAHKSQFPNRNRLLMMSLQPLPGCTGLED